MDLIKFIKDLWEITHLNIDKKITIPNSFSDIVEEQRKKNFSPDKIKILMITDFSEFLDNETPILAVSECNKEGMDIWLDIYGQGRNLKNVQNLIKEQNCKNIQYKGSFRDFHSVFIDYDLFVTSSFSYDAQIQTIGAIRAGLPILVMDVKGDGSSEFICGNGYLIPEEGVDLYKNTLKGFYNNKSQLIAMGQNSRKLFEERYLAKGH